MSVYSIYIFVMILEVFFMLCEKCGAKIEAGRKYCSVCGEKIRDNDNLIMMSEGNTSGNYRKKTSSFWKIFWIIIAIIIIACILILL